MLTRSIPCNVNFCAVLSTFFLILAVFSSFSLILAKFPPQPFLASRGQPRGGRGGGGGGGGGVQPPQPRLAAAWNTPSRNRVHQASMLCELFVHEEVLCKPCSFAFSYRKHEVMIGGEVFWCCKVAICGGVACGVGNTIIQSVIKRDLGCGACDTKDRAISWDVAKSIHWFALGVVAGAFAGPTYFTLKDVCFL